MAQSCPPSKKKPYRPVLSYSKRTSARRNCRALLRIEVTSRLSTSLKFPSQSPSTRPVTTSLGEGSGHSKFEPKRVERALRWNSGSFVGPVFKIEVELRNRPTKGKSSPLGELESCAAEAFINP